MGFLVMKETIIGTSYSSHVFGSDFFLVSYSCYLQEDVVNIYLYYYYNFLFFMRRKEPPQAKWQKQITDHTDHRHLSPSKEEANPFDHLGRRWLENHPFFFLSRASSSSTLVDGSTIISHPSIYRIIFTPPPTTAEKNVKPLRCPIQYHPKATVKAIYSTHETTTSNIINTVISSNINSIKLTRNTRTKK